MAERRMFTMKIIDSDAFLDMPLSTQALYFHLCMRADDDGFINNPRKIQRVIGATDDDLKLLITKRFVLVFDNGVIVIKHWRMHNVLRKDRYHETQYIEEKNSLNVKENGAYTELGNQMATTWQPLGNQMATEDRIGKDRIGKDSIYTIKDSVRGTEEPLNVTDDDLKKVIDAWNELPVAHIMKLTPDTNRYNAIKARIRQYGINATLEAINLISQSPFLLGQNKRNWQITFDWFVKPNNFVKVYEGNYSNKESHDKGRLDWIDEL